ncbi:MAG: DUF4981 domain-containing protein, partial [Planctomycetes bacterium]|nr:DUF4981 domain-containing protein [Planctomycetota bacterium]
KVYDNVEVVADDLAHGRVTVKNGYFFTDLSEFECTFEVLEDGRVVHSGPLGRLAVPPRESRPLTLPLAAVTRRRGCEYFVDVRFALPADTGWAEAGHVVAREQLALPFEPDPGRADVGPMRGAVERPLEFGQGRCTARFSPRTGLLESYVLDGVELLAAPLRPNFWRAPTDNDKGNGMPARCAIWRAPAIRFDEPVAASIESAGKQPFQVEANFVLEDGRSKGRVVQQVLADGAILIDYTFSPSGDKLPEIPRVGLTFEMSSRYREVAWYGRGPHESYSDRKSGAFFGVYELPVAALNHDYLEPQEHGNRCDARWLTLADGRDGGLRVRRVVRPDGVSEPFSFSVWPHTQAALEAAAHPHEVAPSDHLTVNVDAAQTGVGGDDSWGARPHPQYTLAPRGDYRLQFVLEPLR